MTDTRMDGKYCEGGDHETCDDCLLCVTCQECKCVPVKVDFLKARKTARGFSLMEFSDLYGKQCSLQKSSLATFDAIWLGIDDPDPQILHGDAKKLGMDPGVNCGWVPYPIPPEVLITTRMHLTREQVAELLPVLQKFVDTGEI